MPPLSNRRMKLTTNPAERFGLEGQWVSEEYLWSSASFSLTHRWYKLCTQLKAMVGKIQQWCQNDTQIIADLGFLAPSAFGFNSATVRCKKCACITCDALIVLKETCESLVISKQEQAHAEKEHAEAEKEHAEAEKQRAEAEMKGTDTESRMAPHDPSAKKDRTLELLGERVADKAGRVADKAYFIFQDAYAIYLAHIEVRLLLEALRASGKESSFAFSSDFDSAKSSDDSSKAMVDLEVRSSWFKFDNLCHPSEIELDMLDFIPSLDANHKVLIDPFYKNLKLIVGTAAMLKCGDKSYRKMVNATVNGINEWNTAKPTDQSRTKLYAPDCGSRERDGTHPILRAILVEMMHVLGLEWHIAREQEIRTVDDCPARSVEFFVTRAVAHVLTVAPAMLGDSMDVKPTTRKYADVARLLLDAQDQVIGRLAERALFSLDFGGIGEDCQVFGLELNKGSVSVIVLKLAGVGTCDVSITTQRTKPMPLFDAETRRHLFGDTTRDGGFSSDGVKEQEGTPAGFHLLARMLMSVQPGVETFLSKTVCSKGNKKRQGSLRGSHWTKKRNRRRR